MKLNVIYGRSGTGKSEYIYKDILGKLGANNIYVIVPEQCNLSAEKKLFDITNKDSLINVEVLTMSRMAYRVANKVGEEVPHLSKAGKDMLIFNLILKEKNRLNFLGKSEKNVELVDKMFTELKKHNVTIQDLKDVQIESEYTKQKLKDIINLYEKYEEILKNRFIDENDSLTMLYYNLDKTDMFDNCIIYVDEFLGFTAQEYNIFEKLLKKSNEINICVPTNDLSMNTDREKDIFYYNKVFINRIIEIAKNNSCEINEIKLERNLRTKSEELRFLEEHFTDFDKRYTENVSDISLFLTKNKYTEMEYVAKNIYNMVKKSGYKYNEIGIITEDISEYSEDAKAIFDKYQIPLFVDEKKELNQNILIKFIIAMLEIFSKNWSYESVFNYLKIGLLEIPLEKIYLLENYCKKWGIKGGKWNKEFLYEQKNDKQEMFENMRKQIVELLMNFKTNVSKGNTGETITKELYSFLTNYKIIDNLNKKIKIYNNIQISEEYNTSYKLFISVLEDICLVFKDEKFTFDRYKEILQVGLNSCELGTIPATQDQVVLGDTERTRSNKLKVLFVLGINDGSFPKANRQEGYLNDNDRDILKEAGIELAKNSIDSLYEEQFNIYRTLTTPENKLYLSYDSTDKQASSLRPSILIKKIKKMFPKLIEQSDVIETKYSITNELVTFEEALNIYKDYLDGKDISDEWKNLLVYFYQKNMKSFKRAVSGIYYTNKSEDISKENIEKLYGNYLKTSVSRLESYRRCPFSFHLTYGLKIKEKDELKIQSLDTGSFMHEVLDLFFKEIDKNELNIKEIEDEEIYEIVSNIINELLEVNRYYIFSCSAKYRLLTRRLKKVIYKSICYIVYSLKNSDFSVLGHEIEFSNNGDFKNIKLNVDDKNVEITGKIDRVDIAKLSDKQFVRIIDYKSSDKQLDMSQILAGLQIQLITYLDAVCEQTDYEASGILYMGLIDNVVKDAKNMSEEEIESKLRNNFRMKGLVLADVSVVKMMDNKLETGASDIIPVFITKDGDISEKRSSVINKEKFDELQVKVKQIIKEISKEILRGKIDIKPYSYNNKTGCDYCSYKPICMFNTNLKDNTYNYISKKGRDS